ncbi:peroxiredoxin [Lutibacter holmesii]|uniref:thioredoxin-dependent peroxiredoxin n=1 Tax=Lutibacter holmesii TaxID=1137985 RepID=A0ABW3WM55_9FLAO
MKTFVKTFFLFIVTTTIFSQEKNTTIENFSAIDDTGTLWESSTITTDFLVVYFYPAAMTGGCTKQACAYRDDKSTFDDLGISIVAISGDDVSNLKHFKEAYQLNFPLLSDSNGEISKQFGVPTRDGGSISREINGEDFLLSRNITTPRWTFVLDKDRKIIYKNAQVNAAEDSKKVQEVIQNYKQAK